MSDQDKALMAFLIALAFCSLGAFYFMWRGL